MRKLRHRHQEEAELNITAFMNLMIVLVPVLLMTMVFSHITVLGLTLPDAASSPDTPEEDQHLELVVRDTELQVYYPRGYLLKRIEQIDVSPEEGETPESVLDPETGEPEKQHDYELLANVLQEVKRLLKEKEIDKRDITILSQEDTDYQTIVSLMDASRSFKAVVAGSVVNAELFPEVSLGDAPILAEQVVVSP
ncbi:MAG: ExbD/TolR family protein [Pseudomonadales bacterium]